MAEIPVTNRRVRDRSALERPRAHHPELRAGARCPRSKPRLSVFAVYRFVPALPSRPPHRWTLTKCSEPSRDRAAPSGQPLGGSRRPAPRGSGAPDAVDAFTGSSSVRVHDQGSTERRGQLGVEQPSCDEGRSRMSAASQSLVVRPRGWRQLHRARRCPARAFRRPPEAASPSAVRTTQRCPLR